MKPDSTKETMIEIGNEKTKAPKTSKRTISSNPSYTSNGQRLNRELYGGMQTKQLIEVSLRWNSKIANRPRRFVIHDRCVRTIESAERLGPPLGEGLQILVPVKTIQRGVRI